MSQSSLYTTSLQFGLKPDSSTFLCTAAIKNIIVRYLHNGSPVLRCFLDASKAFDLVDHDILFEAQMKRGLPLAIICFAFLVVVPRVCVCVCLFVVFCHHAHLDPEI